MDTCDCVCVGGVDLRCKVWSSRKVAKIVFSWRSLEVTAVHWVPYVSCNDARNFCPILHLFPCFFGQVFGMADSSTFAKHGTQSIGE